MKFDTSKFKGVQVGLGRPTLGWHIVEQYDGKPKLGYNDNRLVRCGSLMKFKGDPESPELEPLLCHRGMHASRHILDAGAYRVPHPGRYISRVAVYGVKDQDSNKFVGTYREVLFMTQVDENLWQLYVSYQVCQSLCYVDPSQVGAVATDNKKKRSRFFHALYSKIREKFKRYGVPPYVIG